MASVPKSQLFDQIEQAFRLGGWDVLFLSNNTKNPGRYVIFREGERYTLRVYIWTITHGGKSRPLDEYRIQPTSTNQFAPETGGKTLILGWWPQAEVFAGFDLRRHSGPLGSSPSFQIGEAALRHAAIFGFAPYRKQSGELAIAFQPEFLGTYVQFLRELHDSGKTPSEADVLAKIGANPNKVRDKEISIKVAKKRRFAISQTRRALRDINFGKRVFAAYSHRCAMCGVQLRLLEGAHIVPVAQPNSTDETSNGIALCVLHHKAYDVSLVTFDKKFRIILSKSRVIEPQKVGTRRGTFDISKGSSLCNPCASRSKRSPRS